MARLQYQTGFLLGCSASYFLFTITFFIQLLSTVVKGIIGDEEQQATQKLRVYVLNNTYFAYTRVVQDEIVVPTLKTLYQQWLPIGSLQ